MVVVTPTMMVVTVPMMVVTARVMMVPVLHLVRQGHPCEVRRGGASNRSRKTCAAHEREASKSKRSGQQLSSEHHGFSFDAAGKR